MSAWVLIGFDFVFNIKKVFLEKRVKSLIPNLVLFPYISNLRN